MMDVGVGESGWPRINETRDWPARSSSRTSRRIRLTAVGFKTDTRSASGRGGMLRQTFQRVPTSNLAWPVFFKVADLPGLSKEIRDFEIGLDNCCLTDYHKGGHDNTTGQTGAEEPALRFAGAGSLPQFVAHLRPPARPGGRPL